MSLDPQAERDAADHLARLDALAPGLVSGFHLVGSATLGDYRSGASDLDICVELTDRADIAELAPAHRGTPCIVEGVYLPEGSLDGRYDRIEDVPWALSWPDERDAYGQLQPVLQMSLARYSATLRGTPPALPANPEELRAYARENLVGYWLPLIEHAQRRLPDFEAGEPVPAYQLIWLGTGPARLWHNIRAMEIISKTQATELAAEHWPDLREPLLDIVALRAGEDIPLTIAHVQAVVTLGQRILAECRPDLAEAAKG
ncbi:MAG TPA: hypothetical protein VG756_08685 [Pseudonocardiaceae bacterium]|nr:hypothetical protein [Pseudonocardiaceae bacterium]